MGQAIFLCETQGGAPSQPLLGVVAASLCRSSSKPCRKTFAYLRLGEGASALCSFPCRCVCVFVVLPTPPPGARSHPVSAPALFSRVKMAELPENRPPASGHGAEKTGVLGLDQSNLWGWAWPQSPCKWGWKTPGPDGFWSVGRTSEMSGHISVPSCLAGKGALPA